MNVYFQVMLLGAALSMDAFAVALTNGMTFRFLPARKLVAVPAFFALFQGLMPLLGCLLGDLFAGLIGGYAKYAVLAIFGVLGLRSLSAGLSGGNAKPSVSDDGSVCAFSYGVLLVQAVLTSLDALAAGVSLRLMDANVLVSAAIIALTTFFVCLLGLSLGKRFGTLLGSRAEIIGGLLLIALAIRALF